MRRVIAILLLFLLMLYHGGYYSVYWLVSHQIDRHWQTADIPQPEDLTRISIPMKIPYKANQTLFSQTQGKIIHENQVYRAVYQKYQNDSLHLLVVNDALTAHLNSSIREWIKNTNQTEENNNRSSVVVFSAKHFEEPKSLDELCCDYSLMISDYTDGYQCHHISPVLDIILQPPIT